MIFFHYFLLILLHFSASNHTTAALHYPILGGSTLFFASDLWLAPFLIVLLMASILFCCFTSSLPFDLPAYLCFAENYIL